MNPWTADLEAIRERLNAATPGPWGASRDLNAAYAVQDQPLITHTGMESGGVIASLATDRPEAESYANARFIAHAREDVLALLAMVDHLRQKHAEVQETSMRRGEEISRLHGELRAMRNPANT